MLPSDTVKAVIAAATPMKKKSDVLRFFNALRDAGISFHPDTSFDQYVLLRGGGRMFSDEDAATLDKAMESTFAVPGCDPYEVGCDVLGQDFP